MENGTSFEVRERRKLLRLMYSGVNYEDICKSMGTSKIELSAECHQKKLDQLRGEANKRVVRKNLSGARARAAVSRVKRAVADHYFITVEDIDGPSRQKIFAFPRHVAMWMLHTDLSMSFPSIGREFAGRDHTTALNGFRNVQDHIDAGGDVFVDIEAIRASMRGEKAAFYRHGHFDAQINA